MLESLKVLKLPRFHWYFLTKVRYSLTSSGEPTTKGTRWWSPSGWTSSTLWVPVVASPPACSMMKAMGLHSYSSRSFEGGSQRITRVLVQYVRAFQVQTAVTKLFCCTHSFFLVALSSSLKGRSINVRPDHMTTVAKVYLSLGALLIGRVHEDAPVGDGAVNIWDHGAHVARSERGAAVLQEANTHLPLWTLPGVVGGTSADDPAVCQQVLNLNLVIRGMTSCALESEVKYGPCWFFLSDSSDNIWTFMDVLLSFYGRMKKEHQWELKYAAKVRNSRCHLAPEANEEAGHWTGPNLCPRSLFTFELRLF